MKPLYSGGLCEPVIWMPAPTSRCAGSSTAAASAPRRCRRRPRPRSQAADQRVAEPSPLGRLSRPTATGRCTPCCARNAANADRSRARRRPSDRRRQRRGCHTGERSGGDWHRDDSPTGPRSRTRIATGPRPGARSSRIPAVCAVAGRLRGARCAEVRERVWEQPERHDEDGRGGDDESRQSASRGQSPRSQAAASCT